MGEQHETFYSVEIAWLCNLAGRKGILTPTGKGKKMETGPQQLVRKQAISMSEFYLLSQVHFNLEKGSNICLKEHRVTSVKTTVSIR